MATPQKYVVDVESDFVFVRVEVIDDSNAMQAIVVPGHSLKIILSPE